MSAGGTNAAAGGGGLKVIASGSTSGSVSFPSPAVFVLVSFEYINTAPMFQVLGLVSPGETVNLEQPISFADYRTITLNDSGTKLTSERGNEISYIALG